MSSSDQFATRIPGLAVLLVVGASLLAGCQVRPLHGTVAGSLPAVKINPADNRTEQIVRDEIIFRLSGGAGEAANAAYVLDLRVDERTQNVLPTGRFNDSSAGRTIVRASYSLRSASTSEIVLQGNRQATSLVDLSNQDFARLRAIEDAKERGARALAAMIFADIAAKIPR